MDQIGRELILEFMIDTNRINSRNKSNEMNQLEHWRDDGIITIEMSEVAQSEAINSSNPKIINKANSYIFSKTLANTNKEKELLTNIKMILFPSGANDKNEENDVEIVFNASKDVCILITMDGGILKINRH